MAGSHNKTVHMARLWWSRAERRWIESVLPLPQGHILDGEKTSIQSHLLKCSTIYQYQQSGKEAVGKET